MFDENIKGCCHEDYECSRCLDICEEGYERAKFRMKQKMEEEFNISIDPKNKKE